MTDIRIDPEHAPLAYPRLQHRLLELFVRSAAMGVLSGPEVTRLDPTTVRRLLKSLQQHGLVASAAVDLAPLMRAELANLDEASVPGIEAALANAADALEQSPVPSTEWQTMRDVFGDDSLAQLVGASVSSLRRYAAAQRETPQLVAERLHWLAMVVADLSGAYNAFGIRRWFERPRSQLGGRGPRAVLGRNWRLDGEAARRVRHLAGALRGAQPLAA